MKFITTQTGLVTLLLLIMFAVSGCSDTTEADTGGNQNDVESVPSTNDNIDVAKANVEPLEDADEKMIADVLAKPVDATLTIEGAKVTPSEIIIPMNATILLINNEDTKQRIAMPFYDASVSVDIPPGEQEYIEVNPKYEGRVSIELNGARLGGVTVVE